MRNLKDSHELIRQNEQIVKKSQKHEANLQKNSTLYFQIGLIVCLLLAFGLLELKFETTIPTDYTASIPDDDLAEISIENFDVYEEPKVEVKPIAQQKQAKHPDAYEQVPDDTLDKIFKDEFVEPSVDTPAFDPDVLPKLEKKPEEVFVPVHLVQKVPVYPGCEKATSNPERKKCMSEKIGKLIQRKFEGNDIASDNGLSGRQRINVQFTIDKTGHVTDILTSSKHPKLDKEAVRVINFIPEMIPGRQNNKNVGVIYTLPIIFQVQ